jgi:hypothetical protein
LICRFGPQKYESTENMWGKIRAGIQFRTQPARGRLNPVVLNGKQR